MQDASPSPEKFRSVGLIDNTCAALLPFPAVKAELLLRERHQLDGNSFVERAAIGAGKRA
jgi:hypothetical protein